MKKYLIYAGMFLGSFAVINTGMYFFLNATQPKTIVAAHDAHGGTANDSSAAHSDEHSPVAEPAHAEAEAEKGHTSHGDEEVTNHVPAKGPDPHASAERKKSVSHEEITLEQADAELEPEHIESAETSTANDEELNSEPDLPVSASSADTSGVRIAKLAKLLESMKPADAAAIASELETDVIVSIVLRMRDRNAAKMMAALPVNLAQDVALQMTQVTSR